jgi:hypothetical protein
MQLGAHADFLHPFICSPVPGLMQYHRELDKGTASVHQILCNRLVHHCHWWQKLDLQLWSWDKDKLTKLKNVRKVKSKVKSLRSVHKHFVLAGQTVNCTYYCDILQQLHETTNFGDNRTGCCIMTMNHLALSFSPGNFSPKTTWLSSPHPPYSLDFASWDFSLFSWLKIHHFDTTEMIEAVLITLTEHSLQDAFRKWQKRWERPIHVEGNYFENDGGQ